jgi:hypothetical protein
MYHNANVPRLITLLRARYERPRRRAAEQRDELATLQLIELHSVPAAKPDCRISNWEASVSGYSDSTPAVACCNVFPDFVEPCLPSQVTKPPGRARLDSRDQA